jgi:hypothetical protein
VALQVIANSRISRAYLSAMVASSVYIWFCTLFLNMCVL